MWISDVYDVGILDLGYSIYSIKSLFAELNQRLLTSTKKIQDVLYVEPSTSTCGILFQAAKDRIKIRICIGQKMYAQNKICKTTIQLVNKHFFIQFS